MCWLSCICKNSFKTKITKKETDDNSNSRKIASEPIKKTIELINDGNFSQFKREKLCEALGKSMNLDIYSDSINLKHSYTNMEKTTETDSHTHLMSFIDL